MIPFGYCLFRRLAFIRSEVTAEWALDAVARRVRAASCNRYGIVPRSQVWMFPAFRTRFPDRPLVAWPNKETANNAPDRTSKIRKRFYHNSPLSPAFAGQSAWAFSNNSSMRFLQASTVCWHSHIRSLKSHNHPPPVSI